MSPRRFRNLVWKQYREHGRHTLPWRKTRDPYRILVSEVMLQQTQVDRVVPYYTTFLKRFPTVRALSEAPLADVLRAWQGLGYNRRAKMLHEAAKRVVSEHGGRVPKDAATLETLPGIGPYTAQAVAAFSANTDGICLETNIRTAVTYHYFPDRQQVLDSDIIAILTRVHPKGQAREWYAALMDYGSYLKRSGVRLNARAKGYAKQPMFDGSNRQARGAILRALSTGTKTKTELTALLGPDRREQLTYALAVLVEERFVARAGARFSLAS